MRGAADKLDFGLGLVQLRTIRRWNRPALSQESGIDKDLLADYENGLRFPSRRNLERLAKAFDVAPAFLTDLVPACRSIRLAYETARGRPAAPPPAAEPGRRLEETLAGSVVEAIEPMLLELARMDASL